MNSELLIRINQVVEAAHNQVDGEISAIEKACQKGCNACCHQIVDVFTWEEPRIFDFIYRNFDRKKRRDLSRNLSRWFKSFNKNTREVSGNDPLNFSEIRQIQHVFREKKIACPFLMGSTCSIYKVRPMMCRVHYESESSENCRNNPHLTTPGNAQEIFHNAASKFNPNVYPSATKPLAYLVAEDFGQNIQSKPLTGVIYDPNNMFGRI